MKDDWQTPDWLIRHFQNHFDPCPSNYPRNFNGLKDDWLNPSFVNPPYSNPLAWIEKAIEESKKGINIVLLLRVDPSTKWYRLLIENHAIIAFFNPRFSFKGFKGLEDSPNFAVMLAFLNGKKFLGTENTKPSFQVSEVSDGRNSEIPKSKKVI